MVGAVELRPGLIRNVLLFMQTSTQYLEVFASPHILNKSYRPGWPKELKHDRN
jgi:hypothetical protein